MQAGSLCAVDIRSANVSATVRPEGRMDGILET